MGSASSSHVNSVKNQGEPAVIKKSKVHCQNAVTSSSISSSTSLNKTYPIDDYVTPKNCNKPETISYSRKNGSLVSLSDGSNDITSIHNFEAKEKEAPADEVNNLEKQVKNLETDLAKAHSHNLDLEDQIQSLKESLNCSKLTVISEEPEVEEDNKNERISNLQTELVELKSEFQKLRLKHKRKTKVLTAKLNEAQQSSQIQKLEMIEEVNQLKQSNKELTVQLKQSEILDQKVASEQKVISEDESTGTLSDRTNLVVELSAQVSEQSQIIAELRNELAQKQKEINVLSKSQRVQSGSKDTHHDELNCWERSNTNHISPHPPGTKSLLVKSGRKKTYKIGQRRCIENSNNQLAFYKTVREVSSDSDSDWANEIVASKIHSAPSAVRTGMTC